MIRSLYTYINSKLPTRTTKREHHRKFKKLDIIRTERFDKLIERVSSQTKQKYSSLDRAQEITETQSLYATPRRGILNRCVIDAMLYPRAGSLRHNRLVFLINFIGVMEKSQLSSLQESLERIAYIKFLFRENHLMMSLRMYLVILLHLLLQAHVYLIHNYLKVGFTS